LALEARRRVKEQQKRCLKSEFRNTHFSYTMGPEGVEQFVATPELHSDEGVCIGGQPQSRSRMRELVEERAAFEGHGASDSQPKCSCRYFARP
jgi:hypothetical protein